MTTLTAAPAIPRFLERDVAFQQIRAADDDSGDGRTFEGYAAVFDSITRINSWEGTFDEKIAKGAFKKSIRERTPVLQFDHGKSTTIGSMPIGAIKKLTEDARGLHVSARMHAAPLFEALRENIAAGSINGMSFRFEVVKEDWHYKGKRLTNPDEIMRLLYRYRLTEEEIAEEEYLVRTLKELKVPELGPVVFPAYPDTSASLRSTDMARAMSEDPQMVITMRNSIARAMGEPIADETSVETGVETGDQTDSITPDETPAPDGDEGIVEQASEENEPPAVEGHSEETVEPPAAGHSEPESEAPDGGRSQPPTAVITATNLDDAERQMARKRMAEKLRQRSVQAKSRIERYS